MSRLNYGYEPIGMPGMDQTAQGAAMANIGTPQIDTPDLAEAAGAPGLYGSTSNGNVFNTQTGAMQKPGFFGAGGMAQMGIGAIATLGGLWSSFQQNKIAKKSLALQEKTFETNTRNQTQSYNTELEDRIRTRYATERRDPGEADKYIEKNKL
jgi:hypothetical protein